ncbi:PAS domain-containing sensor histidine kinase [Spirosoma pollinicola]|uniref:histidine kinase n=1 Tax=Spirosoma pollinicola TaxID=2057025 RepID=A0A2K8YY43_9BACT|nr:PAS domain-containing protein [Spirosoma pollinicola]AUD02545.1 PAS domain-containing sensor histidine kinase [Spirosoma pollinicola]
MNQPFAAQSTSLLPDEEALLRRSYDQLQTALSIGLIATWFWDIQTDKVYGDLNLFRLFGIPEHSLTVGLPLHTFTDQIHPDDQSRVTHLINEAIQSGTMYEAEFRTMPDGPMKWVLARGKATYDKDGQPLTLSGALVDVTERKQVELRSQIAETSLRLSVEAARMGTWDYQPLSGELTWSDRTKELFGLPLTAAIDYNVFLQCVHPDDREATDRAVQAILQPDSNGRFACEYRIVDTKGGLIRWIRSNGQAFFNEQGAVYQFIGTVIDITSDKENESLLQRRVEEQTYILEQQAHQLRTTLDASINSIIAMTALRDDTNTIVDFMMDTANEAVIKSNFMTPEQIIGRTLLTVFPGNKENGFFDLYVRVVETGKAEQSSQYYRDEFGLEGWFEVSAVKQGNDGVVVTYNNITERKRAELAALQQEKELKEANAELRRSNENLQQFAHIASHDLQEPLRRIQAFSDILQNQFVDSLSDGERDMVRRVQKSAQRMQLLIKDLLLYSQLSTQRDSFTTVSLTNVLSDVVSDLEMTISEKNATIDVAPLPQVYGSAPRLRQLFQNLITNALKFSSPGVLPLIQIRFRAAQPNELPADLHDQASQPFWLISVADNGIGFDERYKDRIFTPFQRLHNPATYSGTGIGLAICQRVTESHGGSIDVSSEENKGSTFKVFLPALV